MISLARSIRWFALLALLAPAIARAQAVATIDASDDSNPQKKPQGFSLRKEDIKVIDALKDFDRYRDKKAWELAFRAISGVAEGESKGMVPGKDGFFVPMRRQIWRSLSSLPPEGREAYRLFYDAKAKQAYDVIVNKPIEEAGDLNALRKVVEQYFVTSIGDQAADRLGDMYFEAGDFLAADGAWASIVNDYPDSDIPKLRLQVKRATALARASRVEQFNEIAKSIREQYSGQTVMIAGKETPTGDYLDALASASASTQPIVATTQPTEQIALPKEEKPAWQMSFVGKELGDKIQMAVNNMGWGDFSGLSRFVPASAVDSKRIYVNWIGIIFALDQQTGKLLWRTDKFTEIDNKVQELIQWSIDARRYNLKVVGDRLLAVTAPLRQVQSGMDAYRLMCINPETGKNNWTSEIGALSNYDFLGEPLVVDDQIYMVSHTRGAQELFLTVVNLTTGKMEWNVSLGTPATTTNNYRGNQEYPIPTLFHRMGMVYILTNNGATIAVSVPGKRIDWAFTYDMKPVLNQDMWWGYRTKPLVETSGVLTVQDGILFIKEQGNSSMYALDLSGVSPTLKWKRPVDENDMIASIDEKHLFLLGEDVAAMDLQSRNLIWSTKLPMQTGLVQPVFSAGSIYVFASRGVYQVDTNSGDVVRIFRGADKESVGGTLAATGGKLISVSNLAVTAYPVNNEPGKPAP